MADVLNVKVLPFGQYVRLWGGWLGWLMDAQLARGFVEPNARNKLGVPVNTIIVMQGAETNISLLSHEAGHVWGYSHPMWGSSKSWFGRLIGHIVGAVIAGLPTMSAYGFLRHKDKEGLIARYEAAQKVYL